MIIIVFKPYNSLRMRYLDLWVVLKECFWRLRKLWGLTNLKLQHAPPLSGAELEANPWRVSDGSGWCPWGFWHLAQRVQVPYY